MKRESPTYIRTSTAAAMTMGMLPGRFLRQAQLYCINLLLTYNEGCAARCAYCGLSRSREQDESWSEYSFIRVDWPTVPISDVISIMERGGCPHVERVCISMITNPRALEDTVKVVRRINEVTDRVSVLVTPTIINKEWLITVKEAGADMIGVAVDAATPELFRALRGRGVRGPHRWDRYWRTIEDAASVYGKYKVGVHLVVGLGETEREMTMAIQRAESLGAHTHLFSFFPEENSLMQNHPQPPIGQYRRIQLARYIINHGLSPADLMKYDAEGRIMDFGVTREALEELIDGGVPFMTSGCPSESMECACNRPFGNSTPAQAVKGELRNFPFKPNVEDAEAIRLQLQEYERPTPPLARLNGD